MRSQGKITYWNEEKGYGFITPTSVEGVRALFRNRPHFPLRHFLPDRESIFTYTSGIQFPILIPSALHEAYFGENTSNQTS